MTTTTVRQESRGHDDGVTAGQDGSRFDPLSVVQPLWDFLAVSHRPIAADVIFVFGSQDLAVPARAAELYQAGHAPRVLVTGSFGKMTRGVFGRAEAFVFRDHLVSAGVPEAAIVTEPDASNTLENVTFGMAALDRLGARPRTALLVGKGFVMRRCLATFARHHGDVETRACPPTDDVRRAVDRSPDARSPDVWWPSWDDSTAMPNRATSWRRRSPPRSGARRHDWADRPADERAAAVLGSSAVWQRSLLS